MAQQGVCLFACFFMKFCTALLHSLSKTCSFGAQFCCFKNLYTSWNVCTMQVSVRSFMGCMIITFFSKHNIQRGTNFPQRFVLGISQSNCCILCLHFCLLTLQNKTFRHRFPYRPLAVDSCRPLLCGHRVSPVCCFVSTVSLLAFVPCGLSLWRGMIRANAF